MTAARTAGMAIAVATGFLAGTYGGFYVVLATMSWDQPFETQIVPATVGLATMLAIAGGVAVAPNKADAWKPMSITGLGVGVISVIALLLVEADPILLIAVGLGEVVAIVAAAHTAGPSHISTRPSSGERHS